MPKIEIDYANTIIYKIVCNDLNITECYVGHTTNFVQRKNQHKTTCLNEKDKHYNYKLYKTIRENGGWLNYAMIELEKYPCNDVNEACAKEREYYEKLNSLLNTNKPHRGYAEWCFDNKVHVAAYRREYYGANKEESIAYRRENKEEIAAYHREYYSNKKEEIAAYQREYYSNNKEKIAAYQQDNKEKNAAYQR